VAAPVAPVPAVSAVPEGAAAPTGEAPDFQALAELKRQFDDLQPDLAAAYRQFDERDAALWGGEPFTQAGKHLEQADIAAAERDFEPALRALKQAQSEIEALAALATEKLGEAIKEGEAALAAGDAGRATAQFGLALKIDPSSRQAQTGLKRAASLDDVRGLLAAAAALERDGKIAAAAEKYGEALRLDPEASAASDAIARLKSRMAGDAFASAVAKGMAALAREDFSAARDSFKKAAAIRPGSAEASDGLARVERELASRRISDHLRQAQDAEQQERWAEALGEYREALKLDRNLMSAQQGVERTEPRAMIDAEMSAYIDRPDRLFSPEVREAAGKSLDKARTITVPGPKLARQMKTLSDLIDAAQRPVRVALASDKLTDVTIYRIGKLGAFESKEMELLPGRYTVVGSRQGYRDVRRELTVLPGSAPAVLVIRCEDRI
jgi:tetratricopeptide (TPR) repeat protein